MDTHNPNLGHEGLLIFSDCAVVPEPDAEQLSDIAVAAGNSCKTLLGVEPAVAMLSFSTKGSGGKNESVLKVQEAVKMAHEKAPEMLIDGELQLDAALVPDVTDKKAEYDENVKWLLSEKIILAHILIHVAKEYDGMNPEEVVELIEGTPMVSEIAVNPGESNITRIIGDNVEDTVPNEGKITYDIRFHALTPDKSKVSPEFIFWLLKGKNTLVFAFYETDQMKKSVDKKNSNSPTSRKAR